VAEASVVRGGAASQGFYFYLSLWMCAIVALGFIPGFFLPRPDPTVLQNPVVHLHALVYVGWLALVAYQMRLPSQGRVADHRRVGRWLVCYAVLLVIMGLWVTFSRFVDRIEMGDAVAARIQMWPPFSDMLVFPVLFGLALAYRKQAELHKRLMVLACCMLTIPGAARMFFIGNPPNVLAIELIFLSPVYIAILRDWLVERRVYPVYVLGMIILALMPMRMVVVDWPVWRAFTDWLASVV
jgi:hypothetical protein